MTISGTNLGGATGVSFGGTAAKISADSATQITVTSPPGSAGAVSVTVTTPGGSQGAGKFTYVLTPAPAVTGLSPSSGTTAGGTAVTISGTNLGGASVSFGGAAGAVSADSGHRDTQSPPSPTGSAGCR